MTTPVQDSKIGGAAMAFRIVAYIEAATYLLLLASSITFRIFDGPNFIAIMGPVHGVAFLIYVVLVLAVRDGQGWNFWHTVLILFLALVPFGGFWAGAHLQGDNTAPAPA